MVHVLNRLKVKYEYEYEAEMHAPALARPLQTLVRVCSQSERENNIHTEHALRTDSISENNASESEYMV